MRPQFVTVEAKSFRIIIHRVTELNKPIQAESGEIVHIVESITIRKHIVAARSRIVERTPFAKGREWVAKEIRRRDHGELAGCYETWDPRGESEIESRKVEIVRAF